MNGKVLDVTLLLIWAAVFLAVAMLAPGLLNAIVAWVARSLSGGTTR